MKRQFFGDSYDIVKKSLIAWLRHFDKWSAHPMFTSSVRPAEATLFARSLGARLISTEILKTKTDRDSYFSVCYKAGNLFLDPDTGVRLKPD